MVHSPDRKKNTISKRALHKVSITKLNILLSLRAVNYSACLTLSGRMQLVEPLEDIRHHECCCPRGAGLSGDVSLLSEARCHVVHDGDYNAHWLLGYWNTLGQLQLCGKTNTNVVSNIHNVWWLQEAEVKETAETYKEEHLGFEHHSDGARRRDGGSTGRDGETELHVPLQLSSLVRELQEDKFIHVAQFKHNLKGQSQDEEKAIMHRSTNMHQKFYFTFSGKHSRITPS